VQRFPTPLLNPSSRLGAQLAALSFLNHRASTSIEIPSSCAWISGHFSVGIGSQRTPSSKIAASVVLGLALGLSNRSGARYFTAAKKRSSLLAVRPPLTPSWAHFACCRRQRDACYHCRFKKPRATFLSGEPVHFLSITKMISSIVAECLL
jgi:hypothetical protein